MMAMWVSMCCCLHWVTGFHPGTHWTCVPCQIPFKDCGLPESRLACWLPTSVLHQQKLCCYEFLNTWEYYEYISERLGQIDWMSWNWNSLLLPISIPSPHPSSWWGCHCHQAQISQRLHNIRKILQPGISTRHRTTYATHVAWCPWLPTFFSTSTGGTWLHPRAPWSCRCITFSLAKWRSTIEALHWQRSGTFFGGDCCCFFLFAYGFWWKSSKMVWGYPQVKPFFFHFELAQKQMQCMHMLEKTILKSAQACKHLDVLGRWADYSAYLLSCFEHIKSLTKKVRPRNLYSQDMVRSFWSLWLGWHVVAEHTDSVLSKMHGCTFFCEIQSQEQIFDPGRRNIAKLQNLSAYLGDKLRCINMHQHYNQDVSKWFKMYLYYQLDSRCETQVLPAARWVSSWLRFRLISAEQEVLEVWVFLAWLPWMQN